MNEDQKFQEIISRGIKQYFKLNPEMAVLFGKDEYEDEIESGTKEHIRNRLTWFTQWLDEVKQLDYEQLNFETKLR
ncbi:MAG: hypothetical protein ACFFA3_06875 [Promethearchaeota archaeon]